MEVLHKNLKQSFIAEVKIENVVEKYVDNKLTYNHKLGVTNEDIKYFEPTITFIHNGNEGQDEGIEDAKFIIEFHNVNSLVVTFKCLQILAINGENKTIFDIYDRECPPTQNPIKAYDVSEIARTILMKSVVKTEHGGLQVVCYWQRCARFRDNGDNVIFPWKAKSFYLNMELLFDPNENFMINHMVDQQLLYFLKNQMMSEDFGIRCGDDEVKFNKNFLVKASDVFAAMIKNPKTAEAKQSYVVLENVPLDVVKSFKKIFYDGNVTKEVFDLELLMFADRYNIQLLVYLCKVQIMKTICKENLIDILTVADALNDNELLICVVNFATNNKGSFEDNEEWQTFMSKNPKCFTKMFQLMMFKN